MKILYYAWKEYTYEDAIKTLERMGHKVVVDNTPYKSFDEDEYLIRTVTSKIKSSKVSGPYKYFMSTKSLFCPILCALSSA